MQLGRTVAVVHIQSVGILWLLGIPGCSCSTGCKMIPIHTAAAAGAVAVVEAGCTTDCLIAADDCNVAGHSSVGTVAFAAGETGVGGAMTDAADILHCRHNFHHHNHLDKKTHVTIGGFYIREKPAHCFIQLALSVTQVITSQGEIEIQSLSIGQFCIVVVGLGLA